MEIESKFHIEKIVDTDHSTESLRYVHIAENLAIACNGRVLACVPCVTVKGDHLGPVTVNAMEYAREHSFAGTSTLHLIDGKTVVAIDSCQIPRSMESSAVAKEEQLDMLHKSTDSIKPLTELTLQSIPKQDFSDVVLKINPRMLLTLAKALGSEDSITLRMQPNEDNRVSQGIRAEASPEAYGVIMPIIITDGKKDDATQGLKGFCKKHNVTVEITGAGGSVKIGNQASEEHIEKAIEIIKETKRASVSAIQRHLRIGYTMASQIMDVLEQRGIVGPVNGSDPREILV
ncbi:MAG: DNA translocase FtsK [bacterium]